MRVSAVLFAASAALVIATPASAVSPRYWIHDTAEEFLEGETAGVSVLSEGTLGLAPRIEVLAEPEVPYVWDVAVAADGSAYVGTGDDGWILQVRGKETVNFFRCAAFEVLSVAVGPDGRIWAGTAPEGFVYRIDRDGRGEVIFDAEEEYVWDLAFGPDGRLYAAVGPGGAVYRIDPASGKSEPFFRTEDNHVVSLAFDAAGHLLLGTEGRGLVIRVSPEGEPRVLHDCPQGEVGAVLAGEDGVVWAAASSPAEAREEARRESSEQADGNGQGESEARRARRNEEDDFADQFLFEITPAGAGEGVIYRIDAQGNALRFWSSGQGTVFDLAHGSDGGLLAVTGDDGAVYAVHPDGRATLVLDAEEDQVVSLAALPEGRGHVLGTANPSRVLRMESRPRDEGTYVSDVLDAQRVARWGRIEWTGEEAGGRVTLSVRTGNTDKPDETWTEWGRELRGSSAALEVGRARFLQWRVKLERGGSEGPRLRRVRVSSLENNVPPVLGTVEIVPAGARFYDEVPEIRPRPLYQELPGGVKVQYQFDQGGVEEFPPEQRVPWAQGLRQVRWDAIDPNGDFLLFDLAFRREDETRWKTFAEDVDGPHYTFNARGVPDGVYRIRVTASDRRDNPTDERTASADSEIFLIDNTAPLFEEIKHERDGDEIRITARVVDALSDVIRLEYSVDGGDWLDRMPADGIFDAPVERVDLRVELSSGQEHSVLIRGTDNAGNLGSARVLIRP